MSHAPAEFRQQLIDALRLPESLTDFNGHREKAMMPDQRRTNHPKLSISDIMGSSWVQVSRWILVEVDIQMRIRFTFPLMIRIHFRHLFHYTSSDQFILGWLYGIMTPSLCQSKSSVLEDGSSERLHLKQTFSAWYVCWWSSRDVGHHAKTPFFVCHLIGNITDPSTLPRRWRAHMAAALWAAVQSQTLLLIQAPPPSWAPAEGPVLFWSSWGWSFQRSQLFRGFEIALSQAPSWDQFASRDSLVVVAPDNNRSQDHGWIQNLHRVEVCTSLLDLMVAPKPILWQEANFII